MNEEQPNPIPDRPSRRAQAERQAEHRWRAAALFGVLAIGLVGYIAAPSGDGSLPQIDPNAPEVLAFADGHGDHDHSDLRAVPHRETEGGPNMVLLGLGGPVPDVIKENFRMPEGSEVEHVVVAEDGVWQFEGNLPDGSVFWKIIDLNRGLIFNAGETTAAVPFP